MYGKSCERCARVRTRSSVPSQQFEPHYSRKAAKNAESQKRESNTRHKRKAAPLRSLRLRVSNAVPWCSLWLCVSSSVPIRVNPWLLFPGCGSAAPGSLWLCVSLSVSFAQSVALLRLVCLVAAPLLQIIRGENLRWAGGDDIASRSVRSRFLHTTRAWPSPAPPPRSRTIPADGRCIPAGL